ncbi:MAG TPA: PhoU domain-containing protein [Acidimicrobiales bacterium]|nr:PhoU domain-containing protein [Acidimicrobiales bacterium]
MADDPTPSPAISVIVAQIDRQMNRLFAMVGDAVAGATHALLTGDREAAKSLVERDEAIDALYRELERLVLDQIILGADSPQRLRYLITVLRLLPELERSGDLAEHVARRATQGIVTDMSARARGLVERMGEVASEMWRIAADAFADRAPDVADRLDEHDDEMDELLVTFTAELVGGKMSLPVVIELALIGRFYERFGDHAVNIARRVPSRSTRPTATEHEG